ncbi:MAG: carbohydrate binding domain-containing protein [Pirellulaceae bacterium]|nr:carbohydrate binding domain-containing protein [Pirellulaceae bacterium]
MPRWTVLTICVFLCATRAPAADNLLTNGDFEDGTTGWNPFWSRTDQGRSEFDDKTVHGGKQSVRIEHEGAEDWSLQQLEALAVKPGQIYELKAWVRVQGEGTTTLCVTPRGENDRVISWVYGGRTARSADDWQLIRSRFVVPDGVQTMLPRMIGNGPATVWIDDVSLVLAGDIAEMRSGDLPAELLLENDTLRVAFDAHAGSLAVTDRRTRRTWHQRPTKEMVLLSAKGDSRTIALRWLDTVSMLAGDATIALSDKQPELSIELSADGEFEGRIAFPPPLVTEPGMTLILPVNEGISYPVDDETLPAMHYHLYGGHGLCMGWYGVIDGEQGVLTIVDTPDDATVRIQRLDGRLTLAPEWQPQKGRFGYARRLKYVFFDRGGYVAMCKRYRRQREQLGLVKTLAQKREQNPDVDKLIGAVNVWCWDRDSVGICRELQQAGIKRILWSNRGQPETIQQMNEMGVLTSRYDIYQDTMNPENFPKLRGIHGDWTSSAWPRDLMIGANDDWVRGWRVMGKDGNWYPCGVLCDRQAVDYARKRIPEELKTHPYQSRFIDTTTASPWRECYHPDHPMTRSESREWKMKLLQFISDDCGLVTGSETGHEASVPHVHYFEGMMSLGPYRVPDAGRKMGEILDEVPERVAKFQTGHFYRLPLWELVYHDCVVAQWYWGDYNNKLPKVWDRRDLWNALYGTPPMHMFKRRQWQEQKGRFVQSYRKATTVARATGYSEMLAHRWLADDHSVQQTEFAGGVTVTVNFGDRPYQLSDGMSLGPLEHHVDGLASTVSE